MSTRMGAPERDPLQHAVARLEAAELRRALAAFKSGTSVAVTAAATGDLTRSLDATLDAACRNHGVALACKPGCSSCCALRVEAFAPEVFRIQEHLQRTLTPQALAALKSRLQDTARRAAGLTFEEYSAARLQCAFLDDGRCSIYPVRPALCRAHHSVDAEPCRNRHAEPESGAPGASAVGGLLLLAHTFLKALRGAVRAAHMNDAPHELHQALAAAFEQDDAHGRWRRGEQVFASLPESA